MNKLHFTKQQISEAYRWLADKMLKEMSDYTDSNLLVHKYERICKGKLFGSLKPFLSVDYKTKHLKVANTTFLNMQRGVYIPPSINKAVKNLVMRYNKTLLELL